MRLLRSWPAHVPPSGRNYVVDGIERLILDDYDYTPLADIDDDVLLLEWDIVAGIEDLHAFAERALEQPNRVLVAPYRLYVTTVNQHDLPAPVWCHRRPDGSHVDEGEPTCGYFGFGMIYFPRGIVRAFREEFAGHFSDGSFGGWHSRRVTHQVPITWDIRPVHLHYKLGNLGGPEHRSAQPIRENFMPDRDDPAYQKWVEDPARKSEIAALLRERDALAQQGKRDRLAAVDEQLAVRGYKPEGEAAPEAENQATSEEEVRKQPPKGRSTRPTSKAGE